MTSRVNLFAVLTIVSAWLPAGEAQTDPPQPPLLIESVAGVVELLQAPSTAANDPGSQLFRTYCATCHGTTGQGNGPMADQLRRMPPDLTKYTARNGGVFPSESMPSSRTSPAFKSAPSGSIATCPIT